MISCTVKHDGNTYTRVTKKVARRFWNSGASVTFIPVGMKPFGMFTHRMTSSAAEGEDFDAVVKNYEYYNCSESYRRYTAFYVVTSKG